MLAAQITPLAALTLVAGVWGNRLRRERVMLVSDCVRACSQAVLALLLLTHSARIWELVVLLAVYGAAQAFFVPRRRRPHAAARRGARCAGGQRRAGFAYGIGLMVGPAVAGALIALIGPAAPSPSTPATSLVSAGFLATLHVVPVERVRQLGSFLGELRDGWREVRDRPWLAAMLLRTALLLFIVSAPFQVLGPLVLNGHPHGAAHWGIVLGVFSGGILVGGAGALYLRFARPMVACALLGATAAASPLVLALGGHFVALDRRAGPPRRGGRRELGALDDDAAARDPRRVAARVSAWDWMCSLALWPVGLALAGPVTAAIGLTTTLAVCRTWAGRLVVGPHGRRRVRGYGRDRGPTRPATAP